MPSTPPTVQVAAEDIPFLAHKALQMISDPKLTKERAVALAVQFAHRVRCGWVRSAYSDGSLEVRCLGRFDLDNPIVPELPWPSIALGCRAQVDGLKGPEWKSCVLNLHMNVAKPETWIVLDVESVSMRHEGGRMVLNGRPFCGDADGPWSVLNGEPPPVSRIDPPNQESRQSPRTDLSPHASTPPAPAAGHTNGSGRSAGARGKARASAPRAASGIASSKRRTSRTASDPAPDNPPVPPHPSTLDLKVRMLEALVKLLG